jgi:hypothetical protein
MTREQFLRAVDDADEEGRNFFIALCGTCRKGIFTQDDPWIERIRNEYGYRVTEFTCGPCCEEESNELRKMDGTGCPGCGRAGSGNCICDVREDY